MATAAEILYPTIYRGGGSFGGGGVSGGGGGTRQSGAPQYSPSGGYGTVESTDTGTFKYTRSGWVRVADGGGYGVASSQSGGTIVQTDKGQVEIPVQTSKETVNRVYSPTEIGVFGDRQKNINKLSNKPNIDYQNVIEEVKTIQVKRPNITQDYSSRYANQNNTQLPQKRIVNDNVIRLPSKAERVRGYIREKTGISIPSGKQTFNQLTQSPEYEEIGFMRAVTAPVVIGVGALGAATSNLVNKPVAYGVTKASMFFNVPTIKSPAEEILTKVTIGGNLVERPEVNILSPVIVGAVAGTAAELVVFGLANPKTETSLVKKFFSPKVASTEASVSDVIKVGNLPTGEEIFKARAKGITRTVNLANKPLNVINTEAEGLFIVSKDEANILRSEGEMISASTGKGQTRTYLNKNSVKDIEDKITQKLNINQAKGGMTFEAELSAEGELIGTGEQKVFDFGKSNLKSTESESIMKVTENRLKPFSTVLSNAKSLEIARDTNAVRVSGAVTQSGERVAFRTRILSDVYEGMNKVKRYANRFGTKVGSYLRLPRTTTTKIDNPILKITKMETRDVIKQRSLTTDIGSSFEPKQTSIDLDVAGVSFEKPSFPANLDSTEQILKPVSKSTQAATTQAQAQFRAILGAVEKEATKPVAQIKRVKVPSLLKTIKYTAAPTIAKSIYAGTGKYEVTQGYTSFAMPRTENSLSNTIAPPQTNFNQGAIQFNNFKDNQIELLSNNQGTKQKSAFDYLFKEKTPLATRGIVIPRESTRVRQDEGLDEALRLKQPQAQKQDQLQIQIQPPVVRTGNPPKPPPPKPPIKTPTIIIIPKLKKLPEPKSKSTTNTALKNAYDIFIRKKGKEVRIAEGLPFGKATKFGVERNLRDLSASFKLKQRGSTAQEDITYKVPMNLFRPSKGEAGRIVQRRRARLGARTEVSEILSAKRSRKIGRLKLF